MPPVFIATPIANKKNESMWTKEKPNMQQLCRIVLLARQSLQAVTNSIIGFESNESFKVSYVMSNIFCLKMF